MDAKSSDWAYLSNAIANSGGGEKRGGGKRRGGHGGRGAGKELRVKVTHRLTEPGVRTRGTRRKKGIRGY